MAYDDVKVAAGHTYTGMKVGGVHLWDYPDGVWKERKRAPDQWAVRFTSHKRRKRRAPESSGAKVGAEYHWFILAHQRARKVDANTYETDLLGSKHLVAFRQPGWHRWSSQFEGHRTQKQRLLALLEAALEEVRSMPDEDTGALLPLPGMDPSIGKPELRPLAPELTPEPLPPMERPSRRSTSPRPPSGKATRSARRPARRRVVAPPGTRDARPSFTEVQPVRKGRARKTRRLPSPSRP